MLLLAFLIIMIVSFFIELYFTPFLSIIILLIIAKPIFDFNISIGINKIIAGTLSILFINIIIFYVIFYFSNEIMNFIKILVIENSRDILKILNNIDGILGINFENIFFNTIKTNSTSYIKFGVAITGESLLTYIIGNISTFFLLIDYEKFKELLYALFPSNIIDELIIKKNNLKSIIKIEGILVISTAIINIIGFIILRIPSALFLGVLCGILDILPYVGTIIVFIPIIIYNIVMKNYLIVIGLIGLYALTQIIREILEMKFLSTKLDIHPLAIMLSLYIGIKLFGLIGMIIGPIYCLIAKDIIYG